MTITHKAIHDRLKQLDDDEDAAVFAAEEAARAKFEAERKSLVEACEGLGHIFQDGACVICGEADPANPSAHLFGSGAFAIPLVTSDYGSAHIGDCDLD